MNATGADTATILPTSTPNQPLGIAGIDYPLKIAGGVWEPWVYPCGELYPTIDFVKCPYPGFSAEILHYVMKAANLSYEIVPWNKIDHKGSWGKVVGYNDQGQPIIDGLLGLVVNETFASILATFGMSEVRFKALDYSFPVISARQKMGFIIRRPDASVNLNSAALFTQMFHPLVWASFAATFFLIMMLLCITRNFKLWALKRADPETLVSKSGYTAFWDSICMILDEYHGVFGEGLLAGFLCLFLHTTYEGYLVTQMLKETTTQPFTGMRDLSPLIKNNKHRFITYSTADFWTTQVMEAKGEKYETMKAAMLANWPVETNTRGYEKGLDVINADEDGYYVWPGAQEINFPSWSVGRCNVIFIEDVDQGDSFFGFVLNKGTWQSRKIFEVTAGMLSFMLYIDDKYYKYAIMGDKCDRRVGQTGPQPLKVRHYYGLMVIGVSGTIAGLLFLLAEYFYAKVTDKPTRDEQKKTAERRIVKLQKSVLAGKVK